MPRERMQKPTNSEGVLEAIADNREDELDTFSGESGGVSQEPGVDVRLEDQQKAAKLAEALKKDDKMGALKNKILGFFGQAPEQLSSKYSKLGEERMQKNSELRKAYENYLATEGDKVAQAYKEAVGKWRYIVRDEKGNFVDKTLYHVASGESLRDN